MEIRCRVVDREEADEMWSRELVATLIDIDPYLHARKVGDIVFEQTLGRDAERKLPLSVARLFLKY